MSSVCQNVAKSGAFFFTRYSSPSHGSVANQLAISLNIKKKKWGNTHTHTHAHAHTHKHVHIYLWHTLVRLSAFFLPALDLSLGFTHKFQAIPEKIGEIHFFF